jgi:recombination protein RecA
MNKKEKQEKLAEAMAKIDKDMGKGSVMSLSSKGIELIETISTGSLGLDIALGVGGLPKGRVVEIYGPESSGKTTLAIHTIAECQRKGGTALFIDAEHAFDRAYAKKLGVDVDELLIAQPGCGEEALEIADRMISSGGLDMVVIDSVAALVPKAELEGEMGESKMGLHARLMSQALRKMTHTIAKNNTLVIFINQLRDKIGVMFGNPETTTGGNALKFYASVRLDVRRSVTAENSVKQGDVMMGNLTKVRVIKNKVAPPFRNCEFDILFGQGVDRIGEIVDIATDLKVIEKSGSWYSYEGSKLGQGRASVKTLLQDNSALSEEIELKIMNKVNEQSE